MEDTEALVLRARYDVARTALYSLKAGKHNGAERNYGRAYDNMAKAGMVMRLKAKYRGS
jgi:hypothetical protein